MSPFIFSLYPFLVFLKILFFFVSYYYFTDAAGTPIPGLTVQSASGYTYPIDPQNTAPVPEPASLLMLLGGLGVLGVLGRRQRRQTAR